MKNYAGHCPDYPEGTNSEYSISPNEKFIAFSTKPLDVSSWTARSHIYLYSIPEIEGEEVKGFGGRRKRGRERGRGEVGIFVCVCVCECLWS